MAQRLHLLCAGAAKGLVLALQREFERTSGTVLVAGFGAVGALREQLDHGAPCDAIVLTRSMID
ncbi:MAG TPA: ABC transporter substrate-binding protein, partial [Burkholderiaceae bacterium]|nr:ABC transporter substrate-binding protein [Burkholderiaceae bacterium]